MAAIIAATSLWLIGAQSGATAANPGGATPGPGAPRSKAAPAPQRPRTQALTISDARCVPVNSCSANPRQVSTRGRLVLVGNGLRPGLVVAFPRGPGALISRRSPTARIHQSSLGLVAAVPSVAHSGRIEVLSGARHSNAFGPIYVFRHALHPPPAPHPPPLAGGAQSGPVSGTAFDGQGMWIWYVNQSERGNLANIINRAHAAGVTTLFIKSSDGSTNYWAQFSPQLVALLHANGLKVCAWQYVYGTHPAPEADLGAIAVAAGADCLVIDAEAEYEGHYAAAQTYITELRAKVGANFPVGLASFPYVDYHPALPYSVFLGPGGAQYNAPQMYWKAIGTSVDSVYAHTFLHNRIYGRPIFPLGQTYQDPATADLLRFRELAGAYAASGLSYWDWQETTARGWAALAAPLGSPGAFMPVTAEPVLSLRSKGDEVLWMQEHLASAMPSQGTTGNFQSQTDANLRSFQASKGLPVTGQTDAPTWQALLALPPVAVNWTGGGPNAASASRASASGASASRASSGMHRFAPSPASATLPAVRYEIPPHVGQGGAGAAGAQRRHRR